MRTALTLLASLAVAATLAGCQKKADAASSADMSMGSATAKVTMIEYASVSCPHCARWNNDVFPTIKTKYIDTGRVRYVMREALTGEPSIAAAGFLTARCAGAGKYFQVVDAIYHSLEEMETTGQPRPILQRIAQSAGLSKEQFDTCIRDEKALKDLNARWEGYVKDDKINGTPTFIINGKRYEKGEMPLAEMEAAIAEAEARGKSPS